MTTLLVGSALDVLLAFSFFLLFRKPLLFGLPVLNVIILLEIVDPSGPAHYGHTRVIHIAKCVSRGFRGSQRFRWPYVVRAVAEHSAPTTRMPGALFETLYARISVI